MPETRVPCISRSRKIQKLANENEAEALSEDNGVLSVDELDGVAGGKEEGYNEYKDPDDRRSYSSKDLYNPPKYRCSRCGSKNVKNYDPGPLRQMRVDCLDCGYFGCRGSISETSM